MKDWMLLWPGHGERLQNMARVESHVFRSGDGQMPEPDDLKGAVAEFAQRLDRGRLGELSNDTDFEFVLVSLADAKVVKAGLMQRYAIHVISSLDLGIHV